MRKKVMIQMFALASLSIPVLTPSVNVSAQSSDRLEELQQQQKQLQEKSSEVEQNIQNSESEMSGLESEREQLESDVKEIQKNVDNLVNQIVEQQNSIKEIEEKIKKLEQEIAELEHLINRRSDKLEDQARNVQVSGNPTNILNVILSSESLSDLFGRVSFVTQIVDTNKEIVQNQVRDQKTVEENKQTVEEDRKAQKQVKADLEVSKNNLVTEKLALEDRIVQVAAAYDMNAQELENFVSEQEQIASKSSQLSSEMQEEQRKIEEEARKQREEQLRKQREEEQRLAEARAAEEERQAELAQQEQQEQQKKEENQQQENEEETQVVEPATTSSAVETFTAQEPKPDPKAEPEPDPKPEPEPDPKPKPAQSSGWIRPNGGYTTSSFGYRMHPTLGYRRLHAGMDIGGGGTIVAARAGTVTQASYSSGLGYFVKIDHGDGFQSVYGHMKPGLRVAPGQSVSQGQALGTMGTTGNSTGVHLHFEIHKNGTPVNPAPYI